MKTIHELDAVLINKNTGRFPADNQYRLVFQTSRGICSFQVSKTVFDEARMGQKDMLSFRNGRLIRFGSVKETHVPKLPESAWLRPLA